MGKTKYEMALNIMKQFEGQTIGIQKLREIILKNLGGDLRTITGYLMVMRETGIIKEVESMRFKINAQ